MSVEGRKYLSPASECWDYVASCGGDDETEKKWVLNLTWTQILRNQGLFFLASTNYNSWHPWSAVALFGNLMQD